MAYSIAGVLQIAKKFEGWITGEQPSDGVEYEELGFDIIGEETLKMSSDVTDYYVEGNVAYQDQVSLNPEEYTITGEVGELVYYKKDENNSLLGAVPEKLTAVASFLPSTTQKVNQIRNKVIKVSNFVNSIDNIANRIGKLGETENKQQMAVRKLRTLWEARTPINIKTPFMNLIDYVITDLSFTQKDTQDKIEISITFKKIRLLYASAYVMQDILPEGQTRHDIQARNKEDPLSYTQGRKNAIEIGTRGKYTLKDGNIVPNIK